MPANGPPAVPSRNALRVLRKLALAGSTVGSFCTVAAITYDVHRRVSVAERIVENKRALQTSAPRYDATSAARRLSRMMEAAEAGEFMGLDAWKEEERRFRKSQVFRPEYDANRSLDESAHTISIDSAKTPITLGSNTRAAMSKEVSEFVTELGWKRDMLKPGGINDLPPSRPPQPSVKSRYRLQDPKKTTSTVENHLDTSPGRQPTLSEHMQELLERGDYIDAAQIFLDAHPASLRGISSDRRDLALQAFFLNCRQDNVFIARSVFERLEEVDRISPTMWKILIVTLAKKGCIESAATVYLRYKDQISVPGILLDVVLRCLIESRRLTDAKWLLLRNLSKDRDCGLCGAYLIGLWKKTRSIELLNGQFTKILTMLRRLDKNPTEKLVNPMLKAYVESGRFSDAEALVHEMMTTYRIPMDCRMKGLLVYGKALQCDWAAVDEGFQEMQDLGLTKVKRDFTQVFDRVFLEYWPSHTSVEIRDFLYRYIDKFDIIPDQVLYRHILEAVVEKGDESMVSEFTDMARQRGWKVDVDEKAFLDLLLSRRSALEDSPVGFWQMLHAAREENIRATASQQLLGYDRGSFSRTPVNTVANAHLPDEWYKRTLDELTQPSRPVDQYQKLHKQMTYYMHVGKPAEALRCFQAAKTARFHLKPLEVELAVIATLLEHGLGAAQPLVEDAGIEQLPIFFRQIKDLDPSAEAEVTKLAVFRFYRICWLSRRMAIKHHITASTSRRLIASNKPELALDLLVAVYTSKYGRLKAFDGVCMKMFLRAFAATNNLAGMRWCILTAIARGSALNQDLAVEVDRVLGVLRRESTAHEKKEELCYLDFAATVLHGKCRGDPKFLDIQGNPKFKKTFRRKLKGFLKERHIWYEKPRFQQVVQEWDEEYELEKLLHRIDNDGPSILARWNETACREQEIADEGSTLRLEYAQRPPLALANHPVFAESLNFSSATTMANTLAKDQANGHTLKSSDAAEYRRRVHHDADIVIVGAGVMGCALAVALGGQGRSVLLLEQSLKEPDRIIGELLQPGGVSALEQLGLRDCLEGIDAIRTEGYYVTYLGKPVTIPYPVQSPGAPPPQGRSFHHGRFVMKLREAARACPNVTMVETKVTDLVVCSHTKQVLGVECMTKESKDCYFGQLTVVADGYASKFRKQYHPHTPKVKSKFWGLELIDAELPQPHFGHVLLNPDNPPILIYQIGTHETRILCDIPENLPSATVKNGGVKGHLRNVVLPSLPKCVQPSFAAALDKNQLRSMPNSFLPSAANKTPGLVVLGDALNMRHPLTGGGMTVAFNDVVILRDVLSPANVPQLSNTALVRKQLSAFHWRRKMGASVINILAQALYSLFAAGDENLKALQRGCFEYFSLGMYRQPVSLLGGMLKKPQVLFAHFFTVAFLSLWMIIRDSPLYKFPLALIRCAVVFWTACVVILPYMLIEAFC
ncbi:squalene epoxidase-domain-containing protein [Aspergillus varians]